MVPLEVGRIWLGECYHKIPIYPIVYLLEGDYSPPKPEPSLRKRWAVGAFQGFRFY